MSKTPKTPRDGFKENQGGAAGRGPARTQRAAIKKTEASTPKRPPNRYGDAPNDKGPDKDQKPNDGSK